MDWRWHGIGIMMSKEDEGKFDEVAFARGVCRAGWYEPQNTREGAGVDVNLVLI